MAPFKRALFGYRRGDVDAAIVFRDGRIAALEADLGRSREAAAELEAETRTLSEMVIERERELHVLDARLHEARECHERTIARLDAALERLAEIDAQARGQATRIRMKALREAVEVSKRVQALTEAHEATAPADAEEPASGAAPADGAGGSGSGPNGSGPNGVEPVDFDGLYEGRVKLEIGPLGDFSQLVGVEDAVGELGASEISVERFSDGRATLSLRLDRPVDLLRELEDRSDFEFRVRHTAPDNLVLDLDDDADERDAA